MSTLIIGGTGEERKAKAKAICSSFHISRFDILETVAENSIGIDQVRQLEHCLSLKPYNSAFKAAIIHPGELLTMEAQNALLKTLEEAGENTIIIVTAPTTDSLLPTVVSRCQIIRLQPKSEINLSNEELNTLYQRLNIIYQSGAGERLKFSSEIGKTREEILTWTEKAIFALHEILTNASFPKNPKVPKLPNLFIFKTLRSLSQTRLYLQQNINPRLTLETFLLDLPKSPKSPDVRS